MSDEPQAQETQEQEGPPPTEEGPTYSRAARRLTRVVHAVFEPIYGPLPQIAPGVRFSVAEGAAVPNVLGFRDPDYETHMYVLDENMRAVIVKAMSGGVILPPGVGT